MKPVIATNGGAPIVRVIRDEIVVGTRDREETDGTSSSPRGALRLTHEAATLDPAASRLTVRRNEKDARRRYPPRGWAWVSAREIRLLPAGTQPEPGSLYEFHYPAHESPGLRHRPRRDARPAVLPALREAGFPGQREPRPRADRDTCWRFGSSQSGRFLRDFVRDGFNQDESEAQGVRRRPRPHRRRRRRVPQRRVRAAGAHPHPARGPHVPGERVSVLHRAHDRPGDGQDGQRAAQRRLRSAVDGDQHLHRVLAERRVAARHRSARPARRRAARARARLPDRRHPARRHRVDALHGRARASTRAIRTVPTRHCARCSSRSTSGRASGKAPPASRTPTIKDGTLASVDKIVFPPIPGMLAARRVNEIGVLRDWVKPEMDMSKPVPAAGAADRSRRQRGRRDAAAGDRRAARDPHRLEPLQGALSRGRAVRPLRHLRAVRRDAPPSARRNATRAPRSRSATAAIPST